MGGDDNRLDAATWFAGLASLSGRISAGAPLDNTLRLANYLALLAPSAFASPSMGVEDEKEFDRLMSRGAPATVAQAIIGAGLSHRIVAREGGAATVGLVSPDRDGETIASGPSEAIALIRAWLDLMLSRAPPRRRTAQAIGNSQRSA